MRIYVISNLGDDANPGTSLQPAKTLAWLRRQSLENGDAIVLQGGDTFDGTGLPGDSQHLLEVFGRQGITITSSSNAPWRLDARERLGIVVNGPGHTTIENGIILGTSASLTMNGRNMQCGIHVANYGNGYEGPAENVLLKGLDISGFALAGLFVGGSGHIFKSVTVEGGKLHRNANGIHTSGGILPGGRRTLSDLRLLGVDASDNDSDANGSQAGFGASLNGIEDVTVTHGHFNRNGCFSRVGGHAGLMFNFCSSFILAHSELSGNGYGPEMMDGQGVVAHNSFDGEIYDNDLNNNDLGAIGVLPGYDVDENGNYLWDTPCERIVIRGNRMRGNIVSLALCGLTSDITFDDNRIVATWRDTQTAGIDITNHRGSLCRFRRNRIEADEITTLLQTVGSRGLRGVTFGTREDANTWTAPHPTFVYGPNQYVDTLTELIRAVQAEPINAGLRRAIYADNGHIAIRRHNGRTNLVAREAAR